MDAVPATNDGATADAWNRAEAAIKAWRRTLPDDAEFDGIMEECEAWSVHMAATTSDKH
jgi:hypothetical protein